MFVDLDNVKRLRVRANEVRAVADRMLDTSCAAVMRDLASTYERIADQEEDWTWKRWGAPLRSSR
jgi:hypothetical protein